MSRHPAKVFLSLLSLLSIILFSGWLFTSLFMTTGHEVIKTKARDPIAVKLSSIGQGGAYQTEQTYPPNCKKTTSTVVDALKYLPGLDTEDISPKYRSNKNAILCYNNWIWNAQSTDSYLPKDFLKIVGWPQDLFQVKKNVTLLINPSGMPNPVTVPPATPTVDDKKPHNSCDVVIDVGFAAPHIDICNFFGKIVQTSVVQSLQAAFKNVQSQAGGFLWSTPAAYTYQNKNFVHFWNLSIWLDNALLVVILAWVALRGMISRTFHNWLSYSEILEYLPRVAFGLLCAYFSVHLIQVIVDGSNALCSMFSHELFDRLATTNTLDLTTLLLQAIYLILALFLILEEAIRYTILFVIMSFLPALLFTAALKETQGIAKWAIRGLTFFTLMQPVQMAILSVGVTVLSTVLKGDTGNILNYLVSIGIMVLTLSVFFTFARLAFGGITAPLVAASTGLARFTTGRTIQGTRQFGQGSIQATRIAGAGLRAAPGVVRAAPGVVASAYRHTRSYPSQLAHHYARVSKSFQAFDDKYRKALGLQTSGVSPNTKKQLSPSSQPAQRNATQHARAQSLQQQNSRGGSTQQGTTKQRTAYNSSAQSQSRQGRRRK